jgi:GntR family transcriptional regulator
MINTPLASLLAAHMYEYSNQQTPLYKKVQQCLLFAIESGELTSGEAIPTERDLATILNVSRVTVRSAIKELIKEGLLNQKQGAGTFVTPRLELPLSRLTSFTDDMSARGFKSHTHWIERGVGLATPEEAMALNLSPGSKVSRLYRLRFANDMPVALEHATLPKRILADPMQITGSLYEWLTVKNLRPVRALQHIRAELCQAQHADLLQTETDSAILYIERRSFLADGQPVEFTCSRYRGDSYDFIAEMQLTD